MESVFSIERSRGNKKEAIASAQKAINILRKTPDESAIRNALQIIDSST